MRIYPKYKNFETILAIIAGLLVIWYFARVNTLVYISIGLSLVALISNTIASVITWIWTGISQVMGYVMSKVILTIVFFIVLYPIALLSRLFKKDDLMLKKSSGNSYYKVREKLYTKEDIENPW